MDPFIKKIAKINTIHAAISALKLQYKLTPKLQEIIDFIIIAHKEQVRKSGEPYCIHPILVANVTAHFSKDEDIIAAALLHDVVEDTDFDLAYIKSKWGDDIAHMVDGLTKIDEIREHELIPSNSNAKLISSALSFRKMLIASIDDIRVLVVKLCDRLHNMLTLEALPSNKQLRIAEETMLVYVPIAHRLGISKLKNNLEDIAFSYLYPNEYKRINDFIKKHQHAIQLTFNQFISSTQSILEKNGYDLNKIKIYSRIKHYYSIYLKMQRKGVGMDEVLDLFAIRILVDEDIDCYKVLGFLHLEYTPLISRFKDYVSTPKENGYQTIHTTVFFNSKIYEVQVRTFEMNKVAEFGIAAHWKYKNGSKNKTNLKWLQNLEYSHDNIEEFYKDTKQDLFSEEVIVYSPKGEIFVLPLGSTAYDFAYAVHTDVGKNAMECYINKVKKPLLTELKSSDIVLIKTSKHTIYRCSWVDMVKTTRAHKHIKTLCMHRLKEIDELSGINIINTSFSKYKDEISISEEIESPHKIPHIIDYFKHTKHTIEKSIIQKQSFVTRFKIYTSKIKEYKFDNILIYSNFSMSNVSFDHCCHPKFGDDIVAFKENNKALIHHKMCENAYHKIKNKTQMLFCQWIKDTLYKYKMLVSFPNTKGELARLFVHMNQYEGYILSVEYGREEHSYRQYCSIEFELKNSNIEEVKKTIEKKVKIIDFVSKQDAYNK